MEKVTAFSKRIWPILVSLGGALVMILAFFIPSIQDQWDRYQSRKVIEEYVEMGNAFFEEERYHMAEEAYAKAFEYSENKRLDIEIRRLNAKINRVSEDPTWGNRLPDTIREVDFQFLLHMKQEMDNARQRASILNCYGIFLFTHGRTKEAEQTFLEAVRLDSLHEMVYVNLGSLRRELGRFPEAESAYRKAILIEPENARTHYNLGLLYLDMERLSDAETEFSLAVKLDPADTDALSEYHKVLARMEEKPSPSPSASTRK